MNTKEIRTILSEALPTVDIDSDFLFTELDSLSVATVLYVLGEKYQILLDSDDVTPRNFKDIDSLGAMVRQKMSLESKIKQFAMSTPDKVAAICGKDQVSYSGLWEAICKRAGELEEKGLSKGRPYVFRASQDIDFLVTYCAVHCIGAIAVPLENKTSDENFAAVRKEVESYDFPAEISDCLYTTGTTGRSKGVMHSRDFLVAMTDNFISGLGFSPQLLFIVSGPLNHIASLCKIHPTLSVGATLCIVDGLKDTGAFFDAFSLPYEKFATFLVPASIRLLMQFSYDKLCALAPKIDFIETGAAPITGADMKKLSLALPGSRLYNTYGGTEIGCAATYNFNDGRYMEGCIGKAFKNSRVEVTPEGNITVSGDNIMSGYVNDSEGTARVLVNGKIHMSDMGYADSEGMIHLSGRSDDIINAGGFNVNPLEVENAAASFDAVKDSICIAAQHPVTGTALKLLVVAQGDVAMDKRALAAHLKTKLEAYKVPTMYEIVESIDYTYNGKKNRKSYK